jgi:hypothetical protein
MEDDEVAGFATGFSRRARRQRGAAWPAGSAAQAVLSVRSFVIRYNGAREPRGLETRIPTKSI